MRGTLAERFEAKVDRENGPILVGYEHLGRCHIWFGARNRAGYGAISVGNKRRNGKVVPILAPASHVAFFLEEGRWPEPHALHHCDHPSCVRRAHLFEGTKSDNAIDMVEKGRHGTWSHPKARARGETHGSRTRPDCIVHGERIGTAKLNAKKVAQIKAELRRGATHQDLADRFRVSRPNITMIATGKTWKRVS